MQSKELENYIEFLLSAALQRCGNIYDAEDLTQDTLLAAMLHFVRRDIFAYAKVIFRLLRPWRSGILFAHNCRRQYNSAKPNISAPQ